MSKMIKEMEELKKEFDARKTKNGFDIAYCNGVFDCVNIAKYYEKKKHKKKNKGKCEWVEMKPYYHLERFHIDASYQAQCYGYPMIMLPNMKFCPYCGKKIKVVDEDWMGYTE